MILEVMPAILFLVGAYPPSPLTAENRQITSEYSPKRRPQIAADLTPIQSRRVLFPVGLKSPDKAPTSESFQ